MNFLNRFKKNQKPLIIAEIGNNHEGNFENALKLIDAAKESGVDAVKFQTFKTNLYYSNQDKNRVKRLKKFELSFNQFSKLAQYAKKKNLLFISTPLDLKSLDHLKKIVDIIKISSGDNNYEDLITSSVKSNKELIISTGLTSLKEVEYLKKLINNLNHINKTYFLHCVANYPVDPKNANLNFILKLKKIFKDNIGYSDHTIGIDACLISFLLGAIVIEKHFTLDKAFSEFRDHAISADPKDMSLLVKKIEMYRKLMNDKKEKYLNCENRERTLLRRSYYFNKNLKKNRIIKPNDVIPLRPGNGIQLNKKYLIINKKLIKDIKKGTIVKLSDLKK
jgi:N,N'-diacetyllegionaminate synthase